MQTEMEVMAAALLADEEEDEMPPPQPRQGKRKGGKGHAKQQQQQQQMQAQQQMLATVSAREAEQAMQTAHEQETTDTHEEDGGLSLAQYQAVTNDAYSPSGRRRIQFDDVSPGLFVQRVLDTDRIIHRHEPLQAESLNPSGLLPG